jgi:glutamine synthetase
METMKRVASKHNLFCLLHEKPFAGVNGSGKHNNWSLCTNEGENLFEPGDKPEENLQFQLVLACVMRAVDKHADLLRESASDVGNDHRLGAQEAPPAIISIFLGDQLGALVKQIIRGNELATDEGGQLDTGVSTVPVLKRDTTDRNRTSPFAFTGNRFEFRMVGSRDNIAGPNTALNAVMAEAFADAADALEGAEDFESACRAYIKKTMSDHQRIVFNGDGYSEAWVEEAARRGLPNIPCMVEAIPVLTHDDVVELYERFHIFTRAELEARADIRYENYAKQIGIEAKTMIHLAAKRYLPAIMSYTTEVAQSITAVESVGGDASVQRSILSEITACLKEAQAALENLRTLYTETDALENVAEMARAYRYKVVPAMDALRAPVDAAELLMNKPAWPVPTYGDLMFEV